MRRDDAFLLDLLVAAQRSTESARSLTFGRFARSDLHPNAMFKVLEIVGEAAPCISLETRTEHPNIP